MKGEDELLTPVEKAALDATGHLWNLLNQVVGNDVTREDDLRELGTHVHAIQDALLAQGTARAYPGEYGRLLGETNRPKAQPCRGADGKEPCEACRRSNPFMAFLMGLDQVTVSAEPIVYERTDFWGEKPKAARGYTAEEVATFQDPACQCPRAKGTPGSMIVSPWDGCPVRHNLQEDPQ